MRIYLDTCCLNRPFDHQGQERVRLEADAVRLILHLCGRGLHRWASSEVVELEIAKSPDELRRSAVTTLLSFADERLVVDERARALASGFVAAGVRPLDALHLAVASAAGCDVLLTTDDRFLRQASS